MIIRLIRLYKPNNINSFTGLSNKKKITFFYIPISRVSEHGGGCKGMNFMVQFKPGERVILITFLFKTSPRPSPSAAGLPTEREYKEGLFSESYFPLSVHWNGEGDRGGEVAFSFDAPRVSLAAHTPRKRRRCGCALAQRATQDASLPGILPQIPKRFGI